MNFREALFFSSKRSACYNSGLLPYLQHGDNKSYHLQVEIKQEEYQPFMMLVPGPYLRDVYYVSVARKDGERILPAHTTYQFYDVDKCEELLQTWRINTEDGWWIPNEEWGEGIPESVEIIKKVVEE